MKIKALLLLVVLSMASIHICTAQITTSANEKLKADFGIFNNSLLGENVFVFDPGMDMNEIQAMIDTLFKRQTIRGSEFSKNRYALLFKPGKYSLDVKVDYYMSIIGLGKSPEDVIITGAVRSNTTHGNSVLTNFWRSVENITIIPTKDTTVVWGVSQAAPMRRVYIKGNLQLFDKGYASGGFLADSKVDGTISSGPQQQWLTRNTQMGKWVGSNWNMMFVGVINPPSEEWPVKPFTKIKETPVIREKPFLSLEEKGFVVRIPLLKNNSTGPEWINHFNNEKIIPIKDFYITNPSTDNSESLNSALKKGMNLIFTPGIYKLDKSLKVTKKGTVIMGLGIPSLMPVNGNAAIEISDIDGVSVCGLTIDAGYVSSPTLFRVGDKNSGKSHAKDPVFLYDIFFRVGGPSEGSAISCMTVNSKDVCIDHIWLWRADHGNGVGWSKNKCANGIIVNGDNVIVYGLFNEHFQEYQTLWNGNNGRVYFYQSELPYDPPSVESWKHDGVFGYASYKVSDKVTSHEAWGIGIYNVFYDAPCIVDNAIETPVALESKMHHMVIFWLNGNKESIVKSIINGKGGSVSVNNRKSIMD